MTSLLCKPEVDEASEFIEDPMGSKGDKWLTIRDDAIDINSEQEVVIQQAAFKEKHSIVFNFGKRAPARDEYIIALVVIIGHYLPVGIEDAQDDRHRII